MVQQAVSTASINELTTTSLASAAMHWDEATLQEIAGICAIASDVDGMLLMCMQALHP
jgi:hypothetical protein